MSFQPSVKQDLADGRAFLAILKRRTTIIEIAAMAGMTEQEVRRKIDTAKASAAN